MLSVGNNGEFLVLLSQSQQSVFIFLRPFINLYIFFPSNLGVVNRSSCSLLLSQNVFPIDKFDIRYRLDNYFYFIFFDN